jgi:opacity protein-like surface antigen
VRAIAPFDQLSLYALAGIGIYVVSAEAEFTAPGYVPATDSDYDTPVGFHFGGSISARVAPRVSLGAELRYFVASGTFDGINLGLNSIIAGATLAYGL